MSDEYRLIAVATEVGKAKVVLRLHDDGTRDAEATLADLRKILDKIEKAVRER